MRALPVIERALLAAVAIVVVLCLAFLIAWHRQMAAMVARVAADRPRPGAPDLPPPPVMDPAVLAEFARGPVAGGEYSGYVDDHPERDRLRDVLTAPAEPSLPRPVPGMSNPGLTPRPLPTARDDLELAGLLARGLRLDGSPLPRVTATAAQAGDEAMTAALAVEITQADDRLDLLAGFRMRAVLRRADAPAALQRFDAVMAATDQPIYPTIFDRWQRRAGERDAAYLLATLVRTCPADAARRWRAEAGNGFTLLIQSWERWRQVTALGILAEFSHLPIADYRQCSHGITDLSIPLGWWHNPQQLDSFLASMAAEEDAVMTRSTRNVPNLGDPWQPLTFGPHPIPSDTALSLRSRARHRLAVLAARALDARSADSADDAFPADPAALGLSAQDLASHGDDPPLVLRLDGRRLLIAIDRHATLAPYLAETFAPILSTTGEDGSIPLSLTPEAVSIDLGNPAVRAMIADGAEAAGP
jgi:hypothetical protein